MFEDLERFVKLLIVVSFISVPLGVWKMVEIIIWIIQHVRVGLV